MKSFSYPYMVCYADTDAGGVVYHARYIDMAERARMAMLMELGLSCREALQSEKPFGLMIRKIEAEYIKPAFLEDRLTIETRLISMGGATMEFVQDVKRGEELLVSMKLTAFTVSGVGKPTRIPPVMREKLAALL